MFDAHLHSTISDGDVAPRELVAEAKRRGVVGLALTDHNIITGVADAQSAGAALGVDVIPGAEVNARHGDVLLHLLTYSRRFSVDRLEAVLAPIRATYHERIRRAAQACQSAGYNEVTLEHVLHAHGGGSDASLTMYDISRTLQQRHDISPEDAYGLTTPGGACYVGNVPEQLPTARDVIKGLHAAGAVVVLAHPGIIAHEYSTSAMHGVIADLTAAKINGIEAFHPFHDDELQIELARHAREKHLLVTGGSDWHGPNRYVDHALGEVGMNDDHWQSFLAALE